jgi:Peptidase family C54
MAFCNVLQFLVVFTPTLMVSYHFILAENRLLYLDPHNVQSCVEVTAGHEVNDDSFHYQYPQNMDISQLDPSVAAVSLLQLCFVLSQDILGETQRFEHKGLG